MIELRTEVANLKKELVAKKKEVKDLTAERDAALKKKPGPGATAKESKELVDLRGQVLQGSAREKVLREQLDAPQAPCSEGLSGNVASGLCS